MKRCPNCGVPLVKSLKSKIVAVKDSNVIAQVVIRTDYVIGSKATVELRGFIYCPVCGHILGKIPIGKKYER